MANPTTWTVRLGTLSGSNFTQIATETAQQTANTGTGHYITWTLATPVLLTPNTTYAVDIGMLSRTAWGSGIPYIAYSANVATTGVGTYFDSGDLGVGAATVTTTAARDRVFHVDLQDPVNPIPPDGATVTIGAVAETTPGVFSVQATPTSAGTLRLRINAGTNLNDVAGNAVVTTAALLDDITITVNPAPGYATWAATNAPGGAAADDSDGDGVSNGAEYILGGTASAKDGSKLPGIAVTGGNIVFTFQRAHSSIDGAAALTIETGIVVGAWATSYAVPDGAASSNPGVSVVKTPRPASTPSPSASRKARRHSSGSKS